MADIFALFDKMRGQTAQNTGSVEWIVAGLGNPGAEYAETRHNMGFLVIEELARRIGASVTRAQFKGLCAPVTLGGKRVLLLKPQTFMNLSGECIREALSWYKLDISRLLVIHDDISLEPGRLRVRGRGSAGGHNGLKDIIRVCGSGDFARIKVGVGAKPNPEYDLADWVLGKIDKKTLGDAVERAADAVECYITKGLTETMNQFNAAKAEMEAKE